MYCIIYQREEKNAFICRYFVQDNAHKEKKIVNATDQNHNLLLASFQIGFELPKYKRSSICHKIIKNEHTHMMLNTPE